MGCTGVAQPRDLYITQGSIHNPEIYFWLQALKPLILSRPTANDAYDTGPGSGGTAAQKAEAKERDRERKKDRGREGSYDRSISNHSVHPHLQRIEDVGCPLGAWVI